MPKPKKTGLARPSDTAIKPLSDKATIASSDKDTRKKISLTLDLEVLDRLMEESLMTSLAEKKKVSISEIVNRRILQSWSDEA